MSKEAALNSNTFRPARSKFINILPAVLSLFIVLPSCSDEPTGGISGTGKSPATVVNTGLIIGQVNLSDTVSIDGLTVNTEDAEIVINGEAGIVDDLRTGMAVSARVNYDLQRAEVIQYQPLVAGPVETVSEDKANIGILGQKITITEETYLDELTLEDIFLDNVIEVGGGRDIAGNIIADYIRFPDEYRNYFVVGAIETGNAVDGTHAISGTNVNLVPELIRDIDNSTEPADGTIVKAELDPDQKYDSRTPHAVTDAVVVADVRVNAFETVTATGFVTATDASGDFVLRTFVFIVDETTVYKDAAGNVIQQPETLLNLQVRATGLVYQSNQVATYEITIL